jgi:hypothetical protein
MQKTIGVVPAKCRKCGAYFDLGHDLAMAMKEGTMDEALFAASRLKRKSLMCWECRNL